VLYHLSKANVVVDVLSRQAQCNHLKKLHLEVVEHGNLYAIAAESNLYDKIVTAQRNDEIVLTVKFRQPSHEFTIGVGMSFISYPLVLTPLI
jgi:hypothetical protein